MPTLATGNSSPPADAGFSLVEALSALMVVALAVGVVLLAAPGGERKAQTEATRLAARIVAARDESVILNRPVALILRDNGYGFERLEHEGWAPAEPGSALAFRHWAEGVTAQVETTESEPGDQRVARFGPLGDATPVSIIVSGAGARQRVSLEPNGEIHVARMQ